VEEEQFNMKYEDTVNVMEKEQFNTEYEDTVNESDI
jgi:hypothetical protein